MIKKNSFIKKVVLYIAIFTLLLLVLLVVVWNHSRNIMKDNTINASKGTLSIYINNMLNILDNTDRTVHITMNSVGDIYSLGSEDESTRYYAAIRLREVLDQCQLNNSDVDALVIYNGAQNIYLNSTSSSVNYKEKLAIEQFVKDKTMDAVIEIYKWKTIEINNKIYFARIYENDNRILAAFIKVDNLIKQIQNIDYIGDQYYALTTLEGLIIGTTGIKELVDLPTYSDTDKEVMTSADNKYIVVTLPFSREDFKLSCYILVKNLYGKMQFIQIAIIVLIIVAIGFIMVFANYINNEIFHPIKKLLAAMYAIEKGDFDYRIKEQSKSSEFYKVNTSFNTMIDEIVGLKIESYEEKIQLQEAELRYVHLQIKPHFFLNAMTTIHSMSFQNRNEDIRAYIDVLSKNVRYIFRAGLYCVSLKEEITHLEEYFIMQDLLYPDCVFYYIEMEQELNQWKIPQLLLHTFIENEFKHAVSIEHLLSIFIRIHMVKREGIKMLHIIIEDDGPGFPEEIIQKLKSNQVIVRGDGHGVGLWNVKKTMELLYKRDDLIDFSNNELKGSMIQIWIPNEEI